MTAPFSRRRLMALSAGAVTAAAVGQLGPPVVASAHGGRTRVVDRRLAGPVGRAYDYLDVVMDAYGQTDDLRLLQSYHNESGLMTAAFIYDNSLAAIAYLSRSTPADVRRAKLIGDTLLWIQANDESFSDGRVRQAYAAGPMVFYGGSPDFPGLERADGKAAFLWPFGFSGSSVGDLAWAALALAQLYGHTRDRRYLDGAVALGDWIRGRRSPHRFGGFHGGVQGDGVTAQRWCSTEHNIDVYALFHLLAGYTKDRSWWHDAKVAREFVRSMWNRHGGHFWTGTQGAGPNDDPDEINMAVLPEDVNTWAFLSLGEGRFSRGIDWNAANLANTDGGPESQLPEGVRISGVTFSDQSKVLTGPVPNSDRLNDRTAVWLEGNGHMAAALLDRSRQGDRERAVRYLLEAVKAQEILGAGQTIGLTTDPINGRLSNPGEGGTWTGSPLPERSGIVAATSAFDTGFGFGYFQHQHVGATSWFLMAAQSVNPYQPRS